MWYAHTFQGREKREDSIDWWDESGTPLYGFKVKADGDRADDITILRAGIFDDIEMLNQHKPEVEIYTDGRVKWMSPAEGAGQFTGMPPFRD